VRARLSPSHPGFELVLAAGLAAAAVAELASHDFLHTPGQALVAAAIGLSVALRFHRPLLAVALTGAAAAVLEAVVADDGSLFVPPLCMLLCVYAVGSRCTGWRFWAGGVLAAALTATGIVIREGVTSDLALAVGLAAVGLLIGRASGVLLLETEVLQERATVLERERDEHTRRALQQERSRIARELHDVIGHSISVMGLQAGAVRSVLPPDREREREALLAVERVGREAVGEMRRLIGLLRTEEDEPAAPTASLARLETLAAESRAAGQDLTLTVEGDVEHLPAGVDLAGYRIVQEALTNALKHAPGARVTARVRVGDRVLEVEVVDEGSSVPAAAGNGHVGHGLLGMRERALLYGGEVTAAPQPGGGFRVHARLPVESG
jgi:signal transduction histidine kinase